MIGIVGILLIFGVAVALSTDRRKIDLRIVASAFALQAGIAVLVLYVPPGRAFILMLSESVRAILDFAKAGIDMVFGPLAEQATGISFAIHVLPVIIFFLSLMSVLYHLGIMQRVVRGVGGAIRWIVGTRTVESLNAAASIFVGLSSAFAVRPYLGKLTDAQIFTIMVSGLATIDGTVLVAYAQMGIEIEYLLAATFMALPGGLLMAKLMMPDEGPSTRDDEALLPVADDDGHRHVNVILAAANGASDGVRLAVNIGAMLLAFVSLIALLNGIVGGLGSLVGVDGLSVERIFGVVFAPVMYLLSVPWEEASLAGALFGEKVILNEFVAYLHMVEVKEAMSPRTEAVATFALCGFANPTSIAILLGGLGSLVPAKRDLIARYGLRAVVAGSLSNLMSAALAGLLIAV